MQTISLGSPPRPANGEGDVILDIEGTKFVFSWKNGEYTGVHTETNSKLFFGQTQMKSAESTDISNCECCVWPEGGGARVCWSIRCGSTCP